MFDSADLLIGEIIKELEESEHETWHTHEIIDYLRSKLNPTERGLMVNEYVKLGVHTCGCMELSKE